MNTPLILVDPITFKIMKIEDADPWENFTRKFLKKVAADVKKEIKGKTEIDKLKIINDKLVNCFLNSEDCEWASIPSDTRFPGFFSSLADHALATSTVGVALAVESCNKGIDLAGKYAGKGLGDLLSKMKGVIEVVRLLCLLHDSGKPNYDHVSQTRVAIEDFLSSMGFGEIASEMAEAASKHHYGINAKHPPETNLEQIVALADKVAVQDRTFTGRMLRSVDKPLKWLSGNLSTENMEKAEQLADALAKLKLNETTVISRKSSDWETLKEIIPLDYEQATELDSGLLRADKNTGRKLCLVLLEGKGIQGYVMKSSAARSLAGRSSLVEVATSLATVQIEKALALESVIYSTSGSILALVPPSELMKVVENSNDKFEQVLKGGVTFKGCKEPEHISFPLFNLKNGPDYAWKNWENNTTLSTVGRRNFGELYTILNNSIEVLDENHLTDTVKSSGVKGICSVCYEEESLPEKDIEVVRIREGLPEDAQEGYNPGPICLNVDRHRVNLKDGLEKLLVIHFDGRTTIEAPVPKESILEEAKEQIQNSPRYILARRIRDSLEEILNQEEYRDFTSRFEGRSVAINSITSWNQLGRQSKDALDRRSNETDGEAEKGEVFDVAFISGDGDNFGLLKSSMSNITLYRKVSKIFQDVIQNSIAKALAKVIVKQLELYTRYSDPSAEFNFKTALPASINMPFDVLYFGGDDFKLVLDAGFTFIFLHAFRNAIIQKLGSRVEGYKKKDHDNLSIFPLGVSLSVVVAPNRAPVHGTLDALAQLQDKAKELSKHRQEASDGSSMYGAEISVAFQRFTGIPSKESVDELYGGKLLGEKTIVIETAWPRLGSEIFGDDISDSGQLHLVELTRRLLEKGLHTNNVARSVEIPCFMEEAKLRIEYKAARMSKKQPEREAYRLLAENLTAKDLHNQIRRITQNSAKETILRFQHLDVADIMKIAYDNTLLLPGGEY